jgi:hypothetical protein
VSTYEEGDLVLFKTGAIVLHIAGCRPGSATPIGSIVRSARAS